VNENGKCGKISGFEMLLIFGGPWIIRSGGHGKEASERGLCLVLEEKCVMN
jgi:hypothetical protein